MVHEQEQIPGYVRCEAIHRVEEFRVELDNLEPPVGVLLVETADGAVSFAMNRVQAAQLREQLRLFLERLPKDAMPS
jgi:hypothetical protein